MAKSAGRMGRQTVEDSLRRWCDCHPDGSGATRETEYTRQRQYCVYILAKSLRRRYSGITNDLGGG